MKTDLLLVNYKITIPCFVYAWRYAAVTIFEQKYWSLLKCLSLQLEEVLNFTESDSRCLNVNKGIISTHSVHCLWSTLSVIFSHLKFVISWKKMGCMLNMWWKLENLILQNVMCTVHICSIQQCSTPFWWKHNLDV